MENKENVNYYSFYVGKSGYKPPKELEWNVFIESNNQIIVHNIFNHYSFINSLYQHKKEENFETFAIKVRTDLMYYYWSKCEWEIVITDVLPTISKEELNRLNNEEPIYRCCVDLECGEKVDVFTQVMLNWDKFINYLWNNKKLIKKVKI